MNGLQITQLAASTANLATLVEENLQLMTRRLVELEARVTVLERGRK